MRPRKAFFVSFLLFDIACSPPLDYSQVNKHYGDRGPKYGQHYGSQTLRTASCTQLRDFMYYEPEGTGKVPIAIYLPGTLGKYNTPLAHFYLQKIAAKGYLAASVDYGQSAFLCSFYCGCYKPKADCLFDSTNPKNLISVLARTTRGDPNLGIVTWGHSQGGYLAVMSADHNPNIRRVVATGTSDNDGLYECVQPGHRALPSDRLRILIGEHDEVTVPKQTDDKSEKHGFRKQLTAMAEQPTSCAKNDVFSCFRPNGSGFYIVRGSETTDGRGDHQFFRNAEAKGDALRSIDPKYIRNPALPWSLDATVNWLTGDCGNGRCEVGETPQTCSSDCGSR